MSPKKTSSVEVCSHPFYPENYAAEIQITELKALILSVLISPLSFSKDLDSSLYVIRGRLIRAVEESRR